MKRIPPVAITFDATHAERPSARSSLRLCGVTSTPAIRDVVFDIPIDLSNEDFSMNTIYKLVWSPATRAFVAASEFAKGRKKKAGRNVLTTALAIGLTASAPFGAAFAASTVDPSAACITSDGQQGTLDTAGVCAVDVTDSVGARSIGALANAGDYAAGSGAKATGSANGAAVAVGYNANANAGGAIAIGDSAAATQLESIAIGNTAVASGGVGATAIGYMANATATAATALGDQASSTGAYSSAVGFSASASASSAIAIGDNSSASQGRSIAIGSGASASGGVGTTALGYMATATATAATALGDQSNAAGTYSAALGFIAKASGTNAIALDYNSNATANDSVAIGSNAVADRVNTVSVGSAAAARQIVNVGAGTQANDAVNVSQLSPVVSALGGGASIDSTTGAVTGPTYTLANGGTTTTVGGALTGLDNALTTANTNISKNTGDITNLKDQLNSGSVGLVQQASAGANLIVGANTDGAAVDFTGTTGARTLTGVAAGTVSTTSTDAVNGAQLYGVSNSLVTALGGGATVNPDGSITLPAYTVGGSTVHTISDAFANIDGRVTQNTTDITDLTDQVNSGSVGLVQQSAPSANLTVGAATGGAAVDFTGTDGMRRLTGISNGIGDDDAVTMSQLKAAGLYDPSGSPMTVISYDDHSLASATLGGTNGTVINNLAPGLIAAGSMQAVNGGQLFDMQQTFQSKFDSLNGKIDSVSDRVGTIEQGIADGSIGGPGSGTPGYGPGQGSGDNSLVIGDGASASGSNSSAIGNGAIASGDNSTATGAGAVASGGNSTAVGANAKATGENSTALGANSQAKGSNSVALGEGSVADRDNSVSVGSEGNERQITNVAAGTQRTDAANWGQVQDAVNGVKDWANQKFQQVDKRIDRMGAMSAAYGQMAFSAQGIDTPNRVGVGVGTQGGQSAIAVGYSRQLKKNVNLSFGGSASAGDVSVGAGLSMGW